jgi:hypothetical protein
MTGPSLEYLPLASGEFPSIAVGYLLRGADKAWAASADRFLASYKTHAAGCPHVPHVMLKGFSDEAELTSAERRFRSEGFLTHRLDDDGFDITAYARWAQVIDGAYICLFNTHSELLAGNWLRKFILNLLYNDASMVSATGSFESLRSLSSQFPPFPNIHLRSNGICLERTLFLDCTKNVKIIAKMDAFRFESGPQSITRRILKGGGRVAVVGKDGRAYSPRWWPFSQTFRQGTQTNLLVGDNVTRTYDEASRNNKAFWAARSWGLYLNEDYPLKY